MPESHERTYSINALSHDTGIVLHYLRPKEEDMLLEYSKAIPLLTVNLDTTTLNKEIEQLEDKNQKNEWIIRGQLQEKDEEIKKLNEKYESGMKRLKDEMENKFTQMLSVIQQNPLLAHVKPEVLEKVN